MPNTEPRHFTRDTTLASQIADDFGGDAANAEALVQANSMRYSPELEAAQLLRADSEASAEYEKSEVAEAAGLPEETIVSFDRHGDYIVYSFETPDERVHKDVLVVGDGLEDPYDGESPQRAAIRAQLEAAHKVSTAKSEAEDILTKAREEADRIIAEAAQKAQEQRGETVAAAVKADSERRSAAQDQGGDDGDDGEKHPRKAANPRGAKDEQRKSGGGAKSAAKAD